MLTAAAPVEDGGDVMTSTRTRWEGRDSGRRKDGRTQAVGACYCQHGGKGVTGQGGDSTRMAGQY